MIWGVPIGKGSWSKRELFLGAWQLHLGMFQLKWNNSRWKMRWSKIKQLSSFCHSFPTFQLQVFPIFLHAMANNWLCALFRCQRREQHTDWRDFFRITSDPLQVPGQRQPLTSTALVDTFAKPMVCMYLSCCQDQYFPGQLGFSSRFNKLHVGSLDTLTHCQLSSFKSRSAAHNAETSVLSSPQIIDLWVWTFIISPFGIHKHRPDMFLLRFDWFC